MLFLGQHPEHLRIMYVFICTCVFSYARARCVPLTEIVFSCARARCVPLTGMVSVFSCARARCVPLKGIKIVFSCARARCVPLTGMVSVFSCVRAWCVPLTGTKIALHHTAFPHISSSGEYHFDLKQRTFISRLCSLGVDHTCSSSDDNFVLKESTFIPRFCSQGVVNTCSSRIYIFSSIRGPVFTPSVSGCRSDLLFPCFHAFTNQRA